VTQVERSPSCVAPGGRGLSKSDRLEPLSSEAEGICNSESNTWPSEASCAINGRTSLGAKILTSNTWAHRSYESCTRLVSVGFPNHGSARCPTDSSAENPFASDLKAGINHRGVIKFKTSRHRPQNDCVLGARIGRDVFRVGPSIPGTAFPSVGGTIPPMDEVPFGPQTGRREKK